MAETCSTLMLMMEHGIILISDVHAIGESYMLITPAQVIVDRTSGGPVGFALIPWLPHELMDNTGIVISAKRVVGAMAPRKQLREYYAAWAGNEKDKMVVFAKDFENQIAAIQKFQGDRYLRTKERKKREIFVDSTSVKPLPDSIIEMFEEDNNWGDSTVTH